MDKLLVNFGQLQAAAQHIDTAIGSLHSNLADLETQARPLMSTWQGDARAAYEARQRQWSSAAQDLTEILQSIKRALVQSTDDYVQTEKTNTSLFS